MFARMSVCVACERTRDTRKVTQTHACLFSGGEVPFFDEDLFIRGWFWLFNLLRRHTTIPFSRPDFVHVEHKAGQHMLA